MTDSSQEINVDQATPLTRAMIQLLLKHQDELPASGFIRFDYNVDRHCVSAHWEQRDDAKIDA